MSSSDSRYHRQRAAQAKHPNRRQQPSKPDPHHDTERPYEEVAAQIEQAIQRFKEERRR